MEKRKYITSRDFSCLKETLENLWGRQAYKRLKNCSDIKTWKQYATRTLQATKKSIQLSIEVKDDNWQNNINQTIDDRLQYINESNSFDELFSNIASIYIELSFMQIGIMPDRFASDMKVTLNDSFWKLTNHRTAQYVQNKKQKGNLERLLKSREKNLKIINEFNDNS